jgi:hypothetical protein
MESPIKHIPIRHKKQFNDAKQWFLEEVEKVTIPKILRSQVIDGKLIAQRDRIIGTVGRTTNFGFIKTRAGYKAAANNARYPELLNAIIALGNQVVPKGWKYSAITLNHNVKAKKHKDGSNVGDSVIVAVGEFEGGGLYVYDPDGKNETLLDIKDNPYMFNGSIYPHKTQPFKGNRYTLVFFNMKEGSSIKGHTTVGKGVC